MPIRYPTEFTSLQNFELAWERIVRGSNVQYKRFFSHLFPSYTFASRTTLGDLISSIRRGTYQPARAITVYFPKPSGILRPITLLSLNDQVVYQAIANVIANRLYPRLRPHYGVRTFGALYGGRNSLFFYRSWKQSYRAFNAEIRKAHAAGNDILADFDLVSFYDLIDHTVLRRLLALRLRSGELLTLLFDCLSNWTRGNANAHRRGHGIPQGPEPSAFLAEIFLRKFDVSKFGRVKYFRYVDDVKLMGKTFGVVNRALVKLDLKSKALGLVPQAQKIAVRKVVNITGELKAVPSNIGGTSNLRSTGVLTTATKKRLHRLLRGSLERRKGELVVRDATRLRFALYRLPPMLRVLRSVEPLFTSRPDLSSVLGIYASAFSNSSRCAEVLHSALRADPVFDAVAGDYILALDRCAPKPEPRKFRILVAQLLRRSEERSLLVEMPSKLFAYKRVAKVAAARSVYQEGDPAVAGLLLHALISDPRYRAFTAVDFDMAIRHFANVSDDPDLARYCTYLMLTELKLVPGRPQRSGALLLRHVGLRTAQATQSLLLGFFRDHFGVTIQLDWERKLGKRAHSEARRRANVIRGHWGGNPSVLVTAIDSFNDLLVQRYSVRNPRLRNAFRRAAGRDKVPDFGNWIRQPAIRMELPAACPIFSRCHDLRLVADLAHAKLKKTGKFTRPITHSELSRIARQLSTAYAELLARWR